MSADLIMVSVICPSNPLAALNEIQMSSAVFETIAALEAARLHFFIERTRPDTTLTVTIVGERIEIDIFEDDHLEISRFRGDESIEGGKELLAVILEGEK
jgi:hypothetical protein